jgi:hypothetical protein
LKTNYARRQAAGVRRAKKALGRAREGKAESEVREVLWALEAFEDVAEELEYSLGFAAQAVKRDHPDLKKAQQLLKRAKRDLFAGLNRALNASDLVSQAHRMVTDEEDRR